VPNGNIEFEPVSGNLAAAGRALVADKGAVVEEATDVVVGLVTSVIVNDRATSIALK
jgi:hypothetical protein